MCLELLFFVAHTIGHQDGSNLKWYLNILPLSANDPLNCELSKGSLDFNLICTHSRLVSSLTHTALVSRCLLLQNRDDTSVLDEFMSESGKSMSAFGWTCWLWQFASTPAIIMARFAGAFSRYSHNSLRFHALNLNLQWLNARTQFIDHSVNSTSRQSRRRVHAWDRRFGGTNLPLNLLP